MYESIIIFILIIIIIIIFIKRGLQCKVGRELFTPYQSDDPSPSITTYSKNEEKRKTIEDKNWKNILGK